MEGELHGRRDSKDREEDYSATSNASDLAAGRFANSMTPQSETVDGSYNLTLTGYSVAKGIGPGKHFSSGTFAVGGHDWAIQFYPDGKNPEDYSEFVSVFIALASDSFEVQAIFEIILLDQSGNGKHKIHSHFNGKIKSPYTLKRRGSKWGYKHFFRRDLLEKSDYLKDDTLQFTGRVGVLLPSIKSAILTATSVTPLSQQEHLEDSTPYDQSTGDDQSSHPSNPEIGSQSKDPIVNEVKGLRLEDEIAKYHRR